MTMTPTASKLGPAVQCFQDFFQSASTRWWSSFGSSSVTLGAGGQGLPSQAGLYGVWGYLIRQFTPLSHSGLCSAPTLDPAFRLPKMSQMCSVYLPKGSGNILGGKSFGAILGPKIGHFLGTPTCARNGPSQAHMAPKRAKVQLLEAPSGAKRAQNCPNMPHVLFGRLWGHVWAKPFLTIFGPKIGTGCYACVWAILRGGNQVGKW